MQWRILLELDAGVDVLWALLGGGGGNQGQIPHEQHVHTRGQHEISEPMGLLKSPGDAHPYKYKSEDVDDGKKEEQ